jgi:hypothetical protein
MTACAARLGSVDVSLQVTAATAEKQAQTFGRREP